MIPLAIRQKKNGTEATRRKKIGQKRPNRKKLKLKHRGEAELYTTCDTAQT